MAIPITIPRLGWNMDEGIFAGWLKQDGDRVRVGEMIFSLEGEKATEEIESFDEGILRIPPDAPKAGDTVAVGAVIGYLVAVGEALPTAKVPVNEPAAQARVLVQTLACAAGSSGSTPRDVAISPRARRAAKDLGVDYATLKGSGKTGRIRESDIRAAAPKSAAPITSIRKTIADRMLASHLGTAPVTLTTTADATDLVKLRAQFKSAGDVVPSYTDFLVKFLSVALAKHPLLNARWSNEQIVLSPAIHIGVAVDTDAGLVVPVVRDVPSLSLHQLAARSRDLIERARQGRLTSAEMQGGTFTVTNLGSFGIDAFTPIINPPQCAVLGIGRIQRLPVVVDDQIVIRDRISLSLTFDHRIVDGAPASRFLQTLCASIERPGICLLDGEYR